MDFSKRLSLIELREKIGKFEGSIEHREYLKCKGIPGGVPRGVICEVIGNARTEWMISFLVENPELSTFWIEDQLSILPTAIYQRGVDLSRVLMAEAGSLVFQTLRKALRSKLFNCLVLSGTFEELKLLKALQIFTKESNSAVFCLSKTQKKSWAIGFQISVNWIENSRDYQITVIKNKFYKNEFYGSEAVF